MLTRPISRSFIIALVAMLILGNGALQSTWARSHDDDGSKEDHDSAILTFSTVGDSRQDPVNFDPTTAPLSGQDAIWLQNTRAWSRIIRSIEDQRSNFLFFNGDMIMGYGKASVPANNTTIAGIVNSDLLKFYQQYAFWRGMVAGLMEKSTYVVPVPGNHETQCKACGKKAQVENENAWRANMGDLIFDNTRLLKLFGEAPDYENVGNNGTYDGLTTDQSKLSYSFDLEGSHFVVINTDPVGNDAHAPTNWLAADLSSAEARGAQHFFVFGHKPAYTYYYGANLPAGPSGLDNDPASRDAFWNVIEQYGATYFCGHEHVFNMMQPRASQGGKAWQVLVGSGGSPFEASPTNTTFNHVTDRDYAWATVKVYRNGLVKMTAYGFNDHFGPTHVIKTITIHS